MVWHRLVSLSDGTTSLWTSAEFGIIGGGAHEAVRVANRDLLELVNVHLDLFVPTTDTGMPSGGMVTLRAMTIDGQRAVTASEDDLGYGRHPASPVFHAAHDVISQLRMTGEPSAGS